MSETQHSGQGNGHEGRSGKAMSKTRAVVLLAVLLVVAAVLAVAGILPRISARNKLADETKALAAPDVLVAAPRLGQPQQEVVLPGNITAFTDSPIYARTNGYLKKWYFDIGAHVKKGQLLAEIESPEVDQQLLQAKAELSTAEATAGLAKTNAERYQDLLKQDAVTKQDTDTFITQQASTSTQVKSALANVQRLQELVAFEKIYAPFDGVVTARNIDIGQLIDQGTNRELFHMAALHTLRVYVNVPQVYSRAAKPGIQAGLTFVEHPNQTFTGKLVRTSNSIDPASRTLLVEIDVDNRKGELYPGAYAQVHLKLDSETRTLLVPVSALIFRSEGLRIAKAVHGTDGDVAQIVPITIGRDDGKEVEVSSGLQADDRVITNPPDSVIDGEKVNVVQPQAGKKQPGKPEDAQAEGGKK